MLTLRSPTFGVLAVAWAMLCCAPASGLVVVGDQSLTAAPPGDDPGWNNLTIGGSRNFIYLWDGWALSARHVGPGGNLTEPGDPPQSLAFSTGTFQIIPGQNFVVRNPAQVMNSSGQMIDLTTATGGLETDLRLVRLNGDPGLPSVTIAEQSPPLSGEVVIVGHGRSREANETHWNATGNPPTWTEVPSGGTYHGYKAMNPDDDTKRWGKNNIADANNYHNENVLYELLSSTTGLLELETADGKTRNVISLTTSFDAAALANEAQAVDNDSGSSVFYKRNGQWELSGIVNSQLILAGQAGAPGCGNSGTSCAVFGNATTFADLSYYYHSNPAQDYALSISDIIRNNPNYSVIGDVNLNGVVSGDGTGPAATDDVAAFIAGWGYNTGVADITSWKNGDLSGPTGLRDGITDLFDFLALRDAVNGPISGAALAAIGLGHFAVPEPSAALLALVAGSFLFSGMRRRRIRPVG